jgi:hypothetical protein
MHDLLWSVAEGGWSAEKCLLKQMWKEDVKENVKEDV